MDSLLSGGGGGGGDEQIRTKTGLKKAVAFGLTVFLVNVCGTLSFLTLGLTITTRVAGVSPT